MAWQIRRLSVVFDVRAPYSGGLTFLGYFALYCSLAIRQHTHQKQEGVVKQRNLSYCRQYLVTYYTVGE